MKQELTWNDTKNIPLSKSIYESDTLFDLLHKLKAFPLTKNNELLNAADKYLIDIWLTQLDHEPIFKNETSDWKNVLLDKIDTEISDIIETKDSDYGNASVEYINENRVYITETKDRFDEIDTIVMTMEAPNHATVTGEIKLPDLFDENDQPLYPTIYDYINTVSNLAYNELKDVAYNFDAEVEFDAIWSESFGRHNGFTAFEFATMLKEDEEFFHGW
jgi:hypothetical protein